MARGRKATVNCKCGETFKIVENLDDKVKLECKCGKFKVVLREKLPDGVESTVVDDVVADEETMTVVGDNVEVVEEIVM